MQETHGDADKPEAADSGVQAELRGYEKPETVHPAELPGDEGNEPKDGSYPPDDDGKWHGSTPTNGTKPTRILAYERARRAMELRKAGLKYTDIAKQLGYASEGSAHSAVSRAMKSTINEGAGELRAIQYNRLNELLARYYPLALGGTKTDPQTGQQVTIPPDINAAREVRAIMQQINDLMGAAPDKLINHRVSGGVTVDGEIEHSGQSGIIVVDFDQEGWQAALRRATHEGLTQGEEDGSETSKFKQQEPSGHIAPALQELPTGDDDIVDAEVIENEEEFDPRQVFRINE